MRACFNSVMTPAAVSLMIGTLAALILFIMNHTQGDESNTSYASQYFSAFAKLAAENTAVGECLAAAVTTGLVYTFLAKPIETTYIKCCKATDENETAEDATLYNRI